MVRQLFSTTDLHSKGGYKGLTDHSCSHRKRNQSQLSRFPFLPFLFSSSFLTWIHLAVAARNGHQVLYQVLAAGGFSTATFTQQYDGLVLTCGQKFPVRSLGQAVDMGGRVLSAAAFKHVHHLRTGAKQVYFFLSVVHFCSHSNTPHVETLTFSE